MSRNTVCCADGHAGPSSRTQNTGLMGSSLAAPRCEDTGECDIRCHVDQNDVALGLLLLNSVATWTMVGLIWFVQRVHYPLLALVSVDQARPIALEHQRRTAQVVGLPMAVEGFTTLGLLVWRPHGVEAAWAWSNAVMLAVALGSTILLSVPLHARMAEDPDASVGRRLVATNWPRTIAWTVRGVVCAVMIQQVLAA